MAHRKLLYKNPEVDLKNKYPKWMEMGVVIALGVVTILFYSFKDFKSSYKLEKLDISIENIDIPQTEQFQRPPPPARPLRSLPGKRDGGGGGGGGVHAQAR